MHLGVVHEEALNAHSNNVNSPNMGCKSGIPFAKDPYFDKLITKWKPDLIM